MTTTAVQPVMPARPSDRPEIEALMDEAFGTNRREKTAYRLREGSVPVDGLGFVVRREPDHLCGSIEFWPVDLVDDATGRAVPAVLLGPIAVAESCRGQGLGGTLINAGVTAAQAAGYKTIILVGDPEYYSRFGFTDADTKGWSLPGPYDQRRLLAINTTDVPEHATLRKSLPLAEPYQDDKAGAEQ
jgi:predicted N-acetyltransferase YhbS